MYRYRDKPELCHGAEKKCLAKLQACVETMACECEDLLCRSVPTFPGCSSESRIKHCGTLVLDWEKNCPKDMP